MPTTLTITPKPITSVVVNGSYTYTGSQIQPTGLTVKAGETLTAEELAERDALRREYIDSVKASLTGHLENTYYVDEKGNKEKLKKK